jgi:hypothetical protein
MFKFDLDNIHKYKQYNGSTPATAGNDFTLFEVELAKGTAPNIELNLDACVNAPVKNDILTITGYPHTVNSEPSKYFPYRDQGKMITKIMGKAV